MFLRDQYGSDPVMERDVSAMAEPPNLKCVVAPDLARAARGATGGDVRAFEVDMART